MLLFLPAGHPDTPLLASLPDAEALAPSFDGRVLVVDAAQLPGLRAHAAGYAADAVPPAAILNDAPYLVPKRVTAAGGYVVRHGAREPEVLLIFRRGEWDLPKGKTGRGETLHAGALREVSEEVGIAPGALALVGPLGSTLYGYAEKDRYRVKTTHWFLMTTAAKRFTPQAAESITAAEWVPFEEATARVGFESFRAHMRLVRPVLARWNAAG